MSDFALLSPRLYHTCRHQLDAYVARIFARSSENYKHARKYTCTLANVRICKHITNVLFEHIGHKTVVHGRANGTIINDHARASFDESKTNERLYAVVASSSASIIYALRNYREPNERTNVNGFVNDTKYCVPIFFEYSYLAVVFLLVVLRSRCTSRAQQLAQRSAASRRALDSERVRVANEMTGSKLKIG